MSFAEFVSIVLYCAGPASAPTKNSLPPGRLFFLPATLDPNPDYSPQDCVAMERLKGEERPFIPTAGLRE